MATTISDAERKRLVGILGMLGSNAAGERDNAARLAEQFRKQHKATWADLIDGKTVYVSREVIVEKPVYVDRTVIVERVVDNAVPVVIDRPLPLVASFIHVIGSPFPAFFLAAIVFIAVFDLISRILS